MAANEVNIRVNVATKNAEKQIGGLKKSFTSLLAPLKSIGGLLGVAGLGGLIMMGRSFIQTALSAGAGTSALWRFEEASFELRRTLGELLLKGLGPVMDAASKFFGVINKVVKALDIFIWRNWETVLEGIRGSLSSLDRITGGFGSTIAAITSDFKEQGGVAAVLTALFDLMAIRLTKLNDEWDRLKETMEPFTDILDKLRKLFSPLAIVVTILKAAFKGLMELGFVKFLILLFDKLNPINKIMTTVTLAFKIFNGAISITKTVLELIVAALEKITKFTGGGGGLLGIGQGGAQEEDGKPKKKGGLFGGLFGGGDGEPTLKERLAEGSAQLNEAGNMVIALPTHVEEQTKPIWKRIWDGITTGWTNTKNFITGILSAIKRGFISGFSFLKKWFVETGWPAFKAVFWASWNGAKDFVIGIWEDIKTKLAEIWGGIETVATDVFGRIETFIKGVWDTVKGIVDSILAAVEKARLAAASIAGGIGGFIGGIVHRAGGGPASGLTMVGERGPELLDLPGGSNIIPNNRIGVGGRASGGPTVHIHMEGAQIFGIDDLENRILETVRNGFMVGGFRDVVVQ